jgi:hypothetical protein
MADTHKNFAYSTIATAPSPAASGTSLIVAAGNGTLFPTVPFNATIWPTGVQPTAANAEIVRVTNISTDTFTITRTQEGSSARTVVVGDQIAASVTAKTFTDIEANYMNSWSPAIAVSAGTGLQTLAANSSTTGTGSIFVFPMTVPFPLKFNQIILAQSHSYMTTSSGATNTYFSHFGLFSMTSNSMALIASNSFSILETITSVSATWSYPTSTATSGYGYGTSFSGIGNISTTAQMVVHLSGARKVGLQFGGEMRISAGMYWLGILTYRSTAGGVSSEGFSHAGLIGQIINPLNQIGTLSGPMPLGMAPHEFAQSNVRISGWNGRMIMGFATNTAQNGFGGTRIPNILELANLQTLNTTGSVLPLVSFVST